MKKVKNIVNGFSLFTKKHSSEILTGIGISCMISTTILAVKATPKAIELINKAEIEKKENCKCEELTKIEKIKVAWKPYIPAITSCVFGVSCLIGSQSLNSKRNTAIATAYKLSETALKEYRDGVIETIGEKKEKNIRDKINENKIKNNPIVKNEIVLTEKGNTLCYDVLSGRYFKSDIDKIKKSVNEINKKMIHDNYVSLNEFYNEIGIDGTKIGEEIGWSIYSGDLMDVYFSSQIADNGEPCIVIDYTVPPTYDYWKLM